MEIVASIIAALTAIIVAIIEVRGASYRKRSEARADRREKESRLSMDLMLANAELSEVICIAVTGGHLNGNVEAAQKKLAAAKKAYSDFLKDQAAHQVAK